MRILFENLILEEIILMSTYRLSFVSCFPNSKGHDQSRMLEIGNHHRHDQLVDNDSSLAFLILSSRNWTRTTSDRNLIKTF